MTSTSRLTSRWMPDCGSDPMAAARRAMNHIWFGVVEKSIEPARQQLLAERELLDQGRAELESLKVRNADRRQELAQMSASASVDDPTLGIEALKSTLHRMRAQLEQREVAVTLLKQSLAEAESRLQKALTGG